MNGGLPAPRTNFERIVQPPTGLIVKFDGAHWTDELGRVLGRAGQVLAAGQGRVRNRRRGEHPVATGFVSGVGTTIFNMIVNPANGHLYVSNTDARNERRFEGAGAFLRQFGQRTVRGNLADSRITIIGNRVDATPSEQTHRSRPAVRSDSQPGEPPVARVPDGHGDLERRKDALRGGVRLQQGRGVQHEAARKRHLRSGCGEPDPRVRRRAGRSGARRGARSSLRADAVQQCHLDCGYRKANRARASSDAQSRTCKRRQGPALPLRCVAHVEPRRQRLRQLPRVRRLRRSGLGPRRSRQLGDPEQRRVHCLSHPGGLSRQHPFPPHEGSDDDAELARPRQSRRHALARRPPGQFSAQRPTCGRERSTKTRRSTSSMSRSKG